MATAVAALLAFARGQPVLAGTWHRGLRCCGAGAAEAVAATARLSSFGSVCVVVVPPVLELLMAGRGT